MSQVVALKVGGSSPLGHPKWAGVLRSRWLRRRVPGQLCRQPAPALGRTGTAASRLAEPTTPASVKHRPTPGQACPWALDHERVTSLWSRTRHVVRRSGPSSPLDRLVGAITPPGRARRGR